MRHVAALVFAAGTAVASAGPLPEPAGLALLDVEVEAIEIGDADLAGLKLLGALKLSARDSAFGGFSGLEVQAGGLLAVGDQGTWLAADLYDQPHGLALSNHRFGHMSDGDGPFSDKAAGDAEGIDWNGQRLLVSFERDHRVMLLDSDGRLGSAIRSRSFEQLPGNGGLEALTGMPDGEWLAIAETRRQAGFPMFAGPDGEAITRLDLPAPHKITGADLGPDGRYYIVQRDYSVLTGVSIRIRRLHAGADGLPDDSTVETLARFESASGIDNMEGISVWSDSQGRLRLALISDDNFSLFQRTLLLDFLIEEGATADSTLR